jgi:hypothetical protein
MIVVAGCDLEGVDRSVLNGNFETLGDSFAAFIEFDKVGSVGVVDGGCVRRSSGDTEKCGEERD